jgi:hypothetical protein
MAWIKRNLYFLIGGVIALALLGAAGFYLYTQNTQNKDLGAKLDEAYGELNRLNQQKPHPGKGKVDNIKTAEQQHRQLKGFMGQAAKYFTPIEPIPAGQVITDEIFAAQLRNTIEQMQRAADTASIKLPPRYDFSFSAIKSKIAFAADSLPPLAQQLGEVKAICDILFAARINAFDSVRRVRVSPDDKEMADYTDLPATTNDLAVMVPYEVSFRCFSTELAELLTGFAYSPHGIIVKNISIEPAVSTPTVDPAAMNAVGMPAIPPGTPYYPGAPGLPYYPGAPITPPVATPASTTSGRGGLVTVLNEQLLRINLVLEVIKLQDKPVKSHRSAN